nr:septum formation family protein [Corynebacterium mendelii]
MAVDMGNINDTFRSQPAVVTALVAALVGAAATGAYDYVSIRAVEESVTPVDNAPRHPVELAAPTTKNIPVFSDAQPGDCLTWDVGADATVSNFHKTDCAKDHRFEVSSRENLAAFPASEFGPEAEPPSITRQAQLREQLCKQPTIDYLKGTWDPNGRYIIAPILPQPAFWKAGDRTMLCGVQAPNDQGIPQLTRGKAAEQDQSRAAYPGQCIAVDRANATKIVDCQADHALEITQVVDLKQQFPETTPTVDEQDEYLKPICQQAAQDYVGGDDNLYNSTLESFWTVIQPRSWEGGSHTAKCALIKSSEDGFATLNGSAKGEFTINGAPPPPQPPRRPLRNPPPEDAAEDNQPAPEAPEAPAPQVPAPELADNENPPPPPLPLGP